MPLSTLLANNRAWAAAQMESVCRVAVREAWQRGQPLMVHGWIYDLRDGLLRDLNATVSMAS